VLLLLGVIVWKLIAPGEQFLPEFAQLLTDPAIKRGAFSFFSGRSYLTGKLQDRDVAIRLQLKRGRYSQGYLVAAVRTDGVSTLDYDGIDARARDDGGRRALYVLAAQDLLLTVEQGWLKALWKPQGFLIFPGYFSEEKWRKTLDAMQALAASLEDRARDVSRETTDGS
jgi:hypothetical protein